MASAAWMAAGSRCVWPTPSADNPANIDDLWHAAVNGRGSYFSATDPNSLATGLASTLATIVDTPRPGTSAAAASSNPNISAGDNYVFSSYYKSVNWYGDLYRQRFDIATKDLSPAVDWSAKALLDCATTPWAAAKSYVAGDAYRNGNTCYLVTTDYIAGTTFSTVDTDNSAIVSYSPSSCSTAWAPNTSYAVGGIFSQGTPPPATTSSRPIPPAPILELPIRPTRMPPMSRERQPRAPSTPRGAVVWPTSSGRNSLSAKQKANFTTRPYPSSARQPVSPPASAARLRPIRPWQPAEQRAKPWSTS